MRGGPKENAYIQVPDFCVTPLHLLQIFCPCRFVGNIQMVTLPKISYVVVWNKPPLLERCLTNVFSH